MMCSEMVIPCQENEADNGPTIPSACRIGNCFSIKKLIGPLFVSPVLLANMTDTRGRRITLTRHFTCLQKISGKLSCRSVAIILDLLLALDHSNYNIHGPW